MSTLGIVLSAVLGLISLGLIIVILMQSNRSAGLGAISATSSSDTYWSKNKGNSMEGALEKYTKLGGALFIVLALAINFIG